MPSSNASARTTPLSTADLNTALFRAAVEQADIAISITDARAVIEYVNPAFARATGYSAAEAVGRNQSILSNRTTPPDVYQAMWRQITAGQTWHGRLVNCRRDGSRYLADLTVTPVLDADGQISHFLGLHRDVTELHGLECAVRNQKALIELVVDSAPLVMALLSMEDRVALDNQAYKLLMADLGMQEPATVLLEAVRDQLGSGFGPFRPGAHAFVDQQVRLDCPLWHAPRWYACSGVWVAADRSDADAFYEARTEPYLLLVAKDVTRQTVEQERARMAALQAVMAEAGRDQSLRESLAAAAYQIEGPLNVIDSVVTMMGRRGCDPAQAALSEALRAGQAAVEALKSALPPAPPPRSTSVNLNEVVRDVLDLSAYACLSAGVTVSWKPQLVLPMLNGVPTRLRILLKALVDNAIEALNTKGWRQRELSISSRAVDGVIEIEVADSGPGLEAGLRLRAFEPFFSTKKGRGQHLGTGLSSAQQIAVEHGGNIELRDAPGGGCLARVSLPLRRPA